MIMSDIHLHIKGRFYTLPNIVLAHDNKLYQLEHFGNKRIKSFRLIELKSNSKGWLFYRINRKPYGRNKMKSLFYRSVEEIITEKQEEYPF